MFRKALMVALLALSFFATSRTTVADDPFPECNPCPWVR
jgi:hypothetical protein